MQKWIRFLILQWISATQFQPNKPTIKPNVFILRKCPHHPLHITKTSQFELQFANQTGYSKRAEVTGTTIAFK